MQSFGAARSFSGYSQAYECRLSFLSPQYLNALLYSFILYLHSALICDLACQPLVRDTLLNPIYNYWRSLKRKHWPGRHHKTEFAFFSWCSTVASTD